MAAVVVEYGVALAAVPQVSLRRVRLRNVIRQYEVEPEVVLNELFLVFSMSMSLMATRIGFLWAFSRQSLSQLLVRCPFLTRA